MKNMIKLILAVILPSVAILMLATACTTIEPRSNLLLERHTLEVVEIKQELLVDCDVVIPPTIKKYMEGSKDEREDMLSRYSMDSMGSIRRCTRDKETIRVINKQQIEKVNAFNQLEKERLSNLKQALREGKQRESNQGN